MPKVLILLRELDKLLADENLGPQIQAAGELIIQQPTKLAVDAWKLIEQQRDFDWVVLDEYLDYSCDVVLRGQGLFPSERKGKIIYFPYPEEFLLSRVKKYRVSHCPEENEGFLDCIKGVCKCDNNFWY